ncbi:MAG: hypothetical protein Q9169_005341 [Polycauliona sp. 2 TL-2023]
MAHDDKPTNVDGLKRYLDDKRIKYSNIEQIEGGTANFVFRVHTAPNEPTQIYKHAEPYVAASYGSIPFPVDRMDFEATAMQVIGDLMSDVNAVEIPKVRVYDQPSKVLVMTDAGNTTLKEAYGKPEVDIPEIGRLLGEWLVLLHQKTYDEGDIGEGGNPTAKSIYRWPYTHLGSVAAKYGLDVDFCDYVDRTYGSRIAIDDESVCHGDFWPGNIILNQQNTLSVVDWEMCRRGRAELDVAQFAAEAFLLDRFRGGRGLLDAFLKSYRWKHDVGGDLAVNRRFTRMFTVHMGMHLAFWPASVKWAEHDETKAVIEFGHELMRRGDAEDMDWLRENVLGALLRRD